MAMLDVQQIPIRQSPTPPPHGPLLTLDTSKFKAAPIPNKHIPYCSPGPAPSTIGQLPNTPPASPPSKHQSIQIPSILHPADAYEKVVDSPSVYAIDAYTLANALNHVASQPLPEAKQVFPWLHGLHPENQVQLAFFIARRKALRKTPKCIRGITLIKAGDLTSSRLKGSLAPEEIFPCASADATFLPVDPKEGFSVRNFQIQAAKLAMVSDMVIYGDEDTSQKALHKLATRCARAQRAYRESCDPSGQDALEFNTFVVSSKPRTIHGTNCCLH